MEYSKMSKQQVQAELEMLENKYTDLKALNLKLDMSRGKPGPEQLDIVEGLLTSVSKNDECKSEANLDCRNYGLLDGLPEAKQLFADLLGIKPEYIFVGGNSSLNLMFDTVVRCMIFGTSDGDPWNKQGEIKFLCPVPGYDRHFRICQTLGIKMINVPMPPTGPDMDIVESLVADDPSVKGIWCNPMYSNPDGITYSDETVDRLAGMKTAAKDFRIFWDNAYAVHHLYNGKTDVLKDVFAACEQSGYPDRVFYFASTSKISFPGAGVAIMAMSENNLNFFKPAIGTQTISYDKLNQLRHVRYFKNAENVHENMKKMADIIRPKFDAVLNILQNELGDTGIAHWTKPNGGYFISLFVMNGCAKRTYQLVKECGVVMTTVGATYPYGIDPNDSNIRIAPTYPSAEAIGKATEVLTVCARIAACEKILSDM